MTRVTHERAALIVVESLHQLQRRRLTVTARADDSHERPRLDLKVKAAQNVKVSARRVVEPDVFVFDVCVTAFLSQKKKKSKRIHDSLEVNSTVLMTSRDARHSRASRADSRRISPSAAAPSSCRYRGDSELDNDQNDYLARK